MMCKYTSLKAVLAVTLCLPAAAALAQNTDQVAQNRNVGAATDQDTNAGAVASPAEQGNAAAPAAGQLQEVVVTAERRAVSLQETPIAITAVSGETITAQHEETFEQLQNVVPTLVYSYGSNNTESINIRGMGNSAVSPSVTSGVSVLRDGVLMGNRGSQGEPFYDIADVEALEGPQGTFVGASAIAGAMEINTVNPNFNGLNGYLLAKVGNYSDTQFQGAINLPVADTFAMRFAFNDEQQASFYKDIGTTSQGYYVNAAGAIQPFDQNLGGQGVPANDIGAPDDRQARFEFLWKPTDSFQWLSKVDYWYENFGGFPAEPNPGTYTTVFNAGAENSKDVNAGCTLGGPLNPMQEVCSEPGVVTHSQYYYPGETPFVLDYYNMNEQSWELMTRYNEELRYTLPDGIVLRSQSGFVHLDSLNVVSESNGPQNAGTEEMNVGPNQDYMSQEFDVISPTTGKISWIAGGWWDYRSVPDYFDETAVSSPYQPNQLPSSQNYIQESATQRLAAVFAQINWQFTQTLQLQIGARENWDSNFSNNTAPVAPPVGTVLPAPEGEGNYKIAYPAGCSATTGGCDPVSYTVLSQSYQNIHYKDSVPTGKVDLNWTPIPGQNFYVFYARGYRAGGTNSGSTDHPTFNPEYLNDWEAGWKGRLLDGHMTTQIGGYYYNYQNMQFTLTDIEQDNDTTTGTYTANLAPSTIYGIEVAEQARFAGLGISLNVDYNHTSMGGVEFLTTELPSSFGSPIKPPQCLSGHTYQTPCFDYSPYLVNVSGEETPYAPLFTGNITLDYRFHVGSSTLDPEIQFLHMDKQYSSLIEIPYNTLGARNLWNATVDWALGKYDVQFYGTNLTNELYIESNGASVYYGSPRQGGIQATYHF